MRTRGHSREKRKTAEKGQKKMPSKIKLLSQSIRTSGELEKQLNKINIPLVNVEDLLEDTEDIESGLDASEDLEGMETDDESEGFEDENIDYDEVNKEDPFDIEFNNKRWRDVHLAEVMLKKGIPSISFLHVPVADATDAVINGAITERNRVFREMAVFLATKQERFFESPVMDNIANLNQEDIVKHLNTKGYKIHKEHVSRMLDSLFFMLPGIGRTPSRILFKRYGKHRLSKDDKLKFAAEFLDTCYDDISQLEKAKRFWEYIKDKKGIEIRLSSSNDANDRFRNLKNIIRNAEKMRKG